MPSIYAAEARLLSDARDDVREHGFVPGQPNDTPPRRDMHLIDDAYTSHRFLIFYLGFQSIYAVMREKRRMAAPKAAPLNAAELPRQHSATLLSLPLRLAVIEATSPKRQREGDDDIAALHDRPYYHAIPRA